MWLCVCDLIALTTTTTRNIVTTHSTFPTMHARTTIVRQVSLANALRRHGEHQATLPPFFNIASCSVTCRAFSIAHPLREQASKETLGIRTLNGSKDEGLLIDGLASTTY